MKTNSDKEYFTIKITKSDLNSTLYYAKYGVCLNSGNLEILYIWMSKLKVAIMWQIEQFKCHFRSNIVSLIKTLIFLIYLNLRAHLQVPVKLNVYFIHHNFVKIIVELNSYTIKVCTIILNRSFFIWKLTFFWKWKILIFSFGHFISLF